MDLTGLYRRVALERMSSPEQLDHLFRVATPKSWFALISVIVVLGTAVAWGYWGQLTTKVSGEGVLIRSGGIQNVVPLGTGQVLDVRVRVGDLISVGQVIAIVAQPSMVERIRNTREQLADAVKQREELIEVRSDRTRLQLEFLKRQRANLEHEIDELRQQAKFAGEQVPIDEELLTRGLITKQQVYQARQKLVSIQESIASRQAQIAELDSTAFRTENENLEANLDNRNRITDLKRSLGDLEKQLEMESKVVSPYEGQVLEVKVSPGSLVQIGTPIISMHPDVRKLETLIYVPAEKAKEIRVNMDVEVSPTTILREEYGFVRGKVSAVSDYPATEEALMRIFENSPLVRSLTAGGAVAEVRVELENDKSTPSGYRWSSRMGPPAILSGGTICTAEIVTRKQKPISLMLPFIKKQIGLR